MKTDPILAATAAPLKILFEDNHLIAVYKPHGLLTQGDATGAPTTYEKVREDLKIRYEKPGNVYLGLVHRLDRLAGGVLVFAKTSKAASRLSEQIRDRKVKKTYWAWVEGEVTKGGRLVHFLSWDEPARKARLSDEANGKKAVLEYRPIAGGKNETLLEIFLETGQKHQIRCQLGEIGFPILGDKKYGAKTPYRPEAIALTCASMVFRHPTKEEEVVIALDPKEMRR